MVFLIQIDIDALNMTEVGCIWQTLIKKSSI